MLLTDKDIKLKEIPIEWHESFINFMFGQAFRLDENENIYYIYDYRRWCKMNEKVYTKR